MTKNTPITFETALVSLFGIFSFYHFLSDPFHFFYGLPITFLTSVGLVLSFVVILRPRNLLYFAILMIVTLVDYVEKAPINSNHTMVTAFICVATLGTLAWHHFYDFSWSEATTKFVRTLTPLIYFFPFFNKLNTDYFDPEVSCAAHLLRDIPLGEYILELPYSFEIAAYGSLAIEGLLFVLLLVPRWNRYGLIVGVPFHIILAASGTAFFVAFSTLCFFLLFSFVPPYSWNSLVASKRVTTHLSRVSNVSALIALKVFTLFVIHLLLFSTLNYTKQIAKLPWFFFALAFLLLIYPVLRKDWVLRQKTSIPHSLKVFYRILITLFILNALCPYLGLKTKQSLNMFSNLNMAGGHSNHFLVRWPPGPFDYQESYVTLHRAVNPENNVAYDLGRKNVVYYDFLNLLEKHREWLFTYTDKNGRKQESVSYADLSSDADRILHTRFIRKWFGFNRFGYPGKEQCIWPRAKIEEEM